MGRGADDIKKDGMPCVLLQAANGEAPVPRAGLLLTGVLVRGGRVPVAWIDNSRRFATVQNRHTGSI